MKALGGVVVLVLLSLLVLAMAVRIVKQYENGVWPPTTTWSKRSAAQPTTTVEDFARASRAAFE
jgi:Na+-transporting methylmalonyl-CoA/oxaloacetate decarboxylase gamma subunit